MPRAWESFCAGPMSELSAAVGARGSPHPFGRRRQRWVVLDGPHLCFMRHHVFNAAFGSSGPSRSSWVFIDWQKVRCSTAAKAMSSW